MAQEMQKLYNDNDIHPFGSMLVMFIQLPVMMGMFYATMRAATTVYGSFMGMPLSETPLAGFQHLDWRHHDRLHSDDRHVHPADADSEHGLASWM